MGSEKKIKIGHNEFRASWRSPTVTWHGRRCVWSHRRVDCLFNRIFGLTKKNLCITGPLWHDNRFPSQRARISENVSMAWSHHIKMSWWIHGHVGNIMYRRMEYSRHAIGVLAWGYTRFNDSYFGNVSNHNFTLKSKIPFPRIRCFRVLLLLS